MPGGRPRKKRTGPKKPLSAYTLFVVEVRNTISKANPDLQFKEVATLVGQKWRDLPEHHREKYQNLADQDKVRYEREKEEFKLQQAHPPMEDEKPKRKKRKDAPKNPLSAYTYFIMDVRKDVAQANPDLSFREVAIKVGAMWKAMDEARREQYVKKAEQDKARYENEMLEYNARLQDEAERAAHDSKMKKKKKNTPKNPLSAYTYFVMETRPQVSVENPKMSFGEVATRVGKLWRSLLPEQRAKYDQQALEDKERYDREKEAMKRMAQTNAYQHQQISHPHYM